MGHLTAKNAYSKLRDRLDRFPVGAPGQETIYEILKTICSPEEAELAARLPLTLKTLGSLSRKLGIPEDELRSRLEPLADKGMVFDLHIGDRILYMLTPTIVGLFEFSMMRVREDIDQKALAGLLHRYLTEEPDFFAQFSDGTSTTPFRTLIHEETIPETYTEVLDWERAEHVVRNAGQWSVGTCHCRHVAHHLGHDCEKFPMEDSCLCIGPVVDYVAGHDFTRRIEKEEALDLLARSRDARLVHLCDNVQRRPTFICNCCGCCCEVMLGFKKFKLPGQTFSSNFLATSKRTFCTGCGKCAKACPVDAVDIVEEEHIARGKRFKRRAVVDRDVCLGCGVCALACKFEAMEMIPRPRRQITPEGTFARVLTMAIEQGTLQELIVDRNDGLTALAANALIGAILKLPPAKQLLARETLRSRFVDFALDQMKRRKATS